MCKNSPPSTTATPCYASRVTCKPLMTSLKYITKSPPSHSSRATVHVASSKYQTLIVFLVSHDHPAGLSCVVLYRRIRIVFHIHIESCKCFAVRIVAGMSTACLLAPHNTIKLLKAWQHRRWLRTGQGRRRSAWARRRRSAGSEHLGKPWCR